MNVVDSSGWLEYFANGDNADFFAPSIEDTSSLLVPTLSIYEVFKHFLIHRSEQDGLQAVALMQQGRTIDLSPEVALEAARLSFRAKIPMADSILYATAKSVGATFWTQDADFENIPDVKYKRKAGQKK